MVNWAKKVIYLKVSWTEWLCVGQPEKSAREEEASALADLKCAGELKML